MKIAVYCSSCDLKNKKITGASVDLVKELVRNDITIVYGGSNCGIMGKVADTAMENGGKVIGVSVDIPTIAAVHEDNLTECILAKDMPERRSRMIELADGFIALPGGPGTLDEISEVMCYASLDIINKPVILYNIDGFYDSLRTLIERMNAEGMNAKKNLSNIHFADSQEEIMKLLTK